MTSSPSSRTEPGLDVKTRGFTGYMDSDIPVVVIEGVVVVLILVLVDVVAVCLLPLKFRTPHQYGLSGPFLQ